MSLLQNSNAISAPADTGFYDHQIANSCRFVGSSNDDGTHYMYHVQGTPTNADKCTISAWVKRSKLGSKNLMFTGGGGPGPYSWYGFNSSNEFWHLQSGDQPRLESNALFRDTSAWMHIVIANDSTQGTAANRNKVYINGVQYTDWGDYSDYSTQNADFAVNTSGVRLFVGSGGASATNSYYPFDGYIAEYVFIDGTQYAASDFGETKNGVWIPKDPSGLTFGNNGAYLKFESSGDLGNDSSGNNNDFTVTGVAAHDQMTDSPTFNSDSNGGNFPTYNPLTKGSYTDLSEGNLKADSNTGADASYPSGNTAFPSSGKWYYEQLIETKNSTYPTPFLVAFGDYGYDLTRGLFWSMRYTLAGTAQKNTGANIQQFGTITLNSTGGASFASGDIMSWYIDMDNKKAWVAKNGTIPNSGNPANGTNPQFAWTTNPINGFTFGSQEYQSSSTIVNTGSDGTFAGEKTAQGNTDDTGYGNFYYNPPTGFLAMCTGNLPLADEINPALTSDDYPQKLFNPVLYTGSGGTQTINGAGFQPDFTWIKNRGATGDHVLMDSTRGAYGTNDYYYQRSNTTALQDHTTDFHNFASDGFIVSGTGTYFNASGNTFVGWNWRANGGTTSSNTDGSVTSTVQVDPSGGFSIVKWTGTSDSWGNAITLGHGLSSAPNVILGKKYLGNADEWQCFFSDYGGASIGGSNAASNSMVLNSTSAVYTNQSYKGFGGVMPTSTVFTVDGNNLNGSGDTVLAYCFANTEGFIKSGSYIGNGNADGTFVYTGFKPAWLMIKQANSSSNWNIFDTTRDPYNYTSKHLAADSSAIEYDGASYSLDILSNGFKIRSTWASINNGNYIYLTMAENPFQYATAR